MTKALPSVPEWSRLVLVNAGGMDALIEAACLGLTAPRHKLPVESTVVADRAGLYAIYGIADSWRQLGLDDPPDERPLYVGKAEKSLLVRDLGTHFRVGCTGQSTVRRTFAALLRDKLGLRGIPRNQQNPERPAHFALSAEHDAELNQWMNASLDLAVWTKPEDCSNLGAIEVGVFAKWSPPLNVRDNTSPWRKRVSAARKIMATDARAWAAERGLPISRARW
jgi:hypothetical protein